MKIESFRVGLPVNVILALATKSCTLCLCDCINAFWVSVSALSTRLYRPNRWPDSLADTSAHPRRHRRWQGLPRSPILHRLAGFGFEVLPRQSRRHPVVLLSGTALPCRRGRLLNDDRNIKVFRPQLLHLPFVVVRVRVHASGFARPARPRKC